MFDCGLGNLDGRFPFSDVSVNDNEIGRWREFL
jgi:hypothetical protein